MAIINTDEDGMVLAVSVSTCSEGHMHNEIHVPGGLGAEAIVALLSRLGHEVLQRQSQGQLGLIVVSPQEFRAKVNEAARQKAMFGDVENPFGPMASRWG